MGQNDESRMNGRRKNGMNRNETRESHGFTGDRRKNDTPGRAHNGNSRPQNSSKFQTQNTPGSQTSFVRKLVDPDTQKYFLEIANLFESNEVDMEQRSIICGNALEETKGKELELATDYIISHTLQTLLDGSDVAHLCDFLENCAHDFPHIAMDRAGSHVAETIFKSFSVHLEDDEARPSIESALTKICQVIVNSPVDVMCSCYGSHVLRRLLCLCKGVPLDSSEFHVTKSSALAERFNVKESLVDEFKLTSMQQQGFPDLLKFLVYEILKSTKGNIVNLLVDQYSSLVLQTAMKLLVGDDEALLHIIPILLGCTKENFVEEDVVKHNVVKIIVDLMKEAASSRLMEVILEVAPETLYNGLVTKVFRKHLFEMSRDHCGNFVVQALISHAKSKDQMEIIWEELGLKFKDLLEMGRSGVIASLIASSQRLQTHELKCCQALSDAVCSPSESPGCIVPRILFLESFFSCQDKANWNWASGVKMHVLGTLILQAVFRYPKEFNQRFIDSILSIEAEHIFETTRDAGGARVVEAFLNSNASVNIKRKLVAKLLGYFGELSMHPSSSFTVEKCFAVCGISLKEIIVNELLAVRTALNRTRQGPHLLRKLDVDGYARNSDQWRSKQVSKESALKKFDAIFRSNEAKTTPKDKNQSETSKRLPGPNNLQMMRKEIDQCLPGSTEQSTSHKRPSETVDRSEKVTKHAKEEDVSNRKDKKMKKKKRHGGD